MNANSSYNGTQMPIQMIFFSIFLAFLQTLMPRDKVRNAQEFLDAIEFRFRQPEIRVKLKEQMLRMATLAGNMAKDVIEDLSRSEEMQILHQLLLEAAEKMSTVGVRVVLAVVKPIAYAIIPPLGAVDAGIRSSSAVAESAFESAEKVAELTNRAIDPIALIKERVDGIKGEFSDAMTKAIENVVPAIEQIENTKTQLNQRVMKISDTITNPVDNINAKINSELNNKIDYST